MAKERYIKIINERFEKNVIDILLKQLDLFYNSDVKIIKNKYDIGGEVKLKKGTYLHGIPNSLDNFDWIVDNGFIANEFTIQNCNNKIKNSIGMWCIKEDCLLKNYIINYSGNTIKYSIGRGPDAKTVCQLIPYH